jgi:hypothetical protein
MTESALGSNTYALASWLFLRLVGLIYGVAFASLGAQIHGLVGRRGILPMAEELTPASGSRMSSFCHRPTLCWWNTSDRFLSVLCAGGVVLSLCLIAGVAPVPVLALLWLLYLSLVNAGGIFLAYQWDALLLEAGLLAIFLAPPHLAVTGSAVYLAPWPAHWLLRWLLFRLMCSSGVVKLASGDPAWRSLSALRFHYETQPLPTWIGWYVHQLPAWVHRISCAGLFGIELVLPLLLLIPSLAPVAAAAIILLMALIMLTGNYAFFNVLAVALALLVVDDAAVQTTAGALMPGWQLPHAAIVAPEWWQLLVLGVGVALFGLSLPTIAALFPRAQTMQWPPAVSRMVARLAPFRLVNSYGLFAIMTTMRPELLVEGSADGRTWQAYAFTWKPGDLTRRPRFVAPHQPRLDWQMWFAALGGAVSQPWVGAFLARLLEGAPAVVKLLAHNPFPDRPPRYVRALLYQYRFTTVAERRHNGTWWKRELQGPYGPAMTLTRARRGDRGVGRSGGG